MAGGGAHLVLLVALLAPRLPRRDRAQEQRGLLVASALGELLEGVVAEQLEAPLEQRRAAIRLVPPLGVGPPAGGEQGAGRDRGGFPPSARPGATVWHTA